MANSEINSDVLSCGSDYKDSFIHETFNVTTQKLDSPSEKSNNNVVFTCY